jgi:hypothetical protein
VSSICFLQACVMGKIGHTNPWIRSTK